MRHYTLEFMDAHWGLERRNPLGKAPARASFTAVDDDAALAYINEHYIEQLQNCRCAELSSMRMVPDPQAPRGYRLVDDYLENPHFQDTYIRFNAATRTAEVDFDATVTAG